MRAGATCRYKNGLLSRAASLELAICDLCVSIVAADVVDVFSAMDLRLVHDQWFPCVPNEALILTARHPIAVQRDGDTAGLQICVVSLWTI